MKPNFLLFTDFSLSNTQELIILRKIFLQDITAVVDHVNCVSFTSSISVEKSFSKLSPTVAEANKKYCLIDLMRKDIEKVGRFSYFRRWHIVGNFDILM